MLWDVHATIGSTGRVSRAVVGGRAAGLQAQLVVLSCSDEKQWDGSGLGGLEPGCVAQQAWDGGDSLCFPGAF